MKLKILSALTILMLIGSQTVLADWWSVFENASSNIQQGDVYSTTYDVNWSTSHKTSVSGTQTTRACIYFNNGSGECDNKGVFNTNSISDSGSSSGNKINSGTWSIQTYHEVNYEENGESKGEGNLTEDDFYFDSSQHPQ